MFSSVEANANIEPKIGPMHGVHPKPKAIPKIKDEKIPLFLSK